MYDGDGLRGSFPWWVAGASLVLPFVYYLWGVVAVGVVVVAAVAFGVGRWWGREGRRVFRHRSAPTVPLGGQGHDRG